ncbi:MAG: Rieske 2Fe-2S domain-containing protein [Ferruginibacter sp.]
MDKRKEYKWFKIAETIEELAFSSAGFVEVEVNDKKICIARYKDLVFACTAGCPHAGGRLAEGYIDATGNITCPLHRYKFNLQNGRNVSGEGYFLKTFPIEVTNEGVFVGFKENNLLNWLK